MNAQRGPVFRDLNHTTTSTYSTPLFLPLLAPHSPQRPYASHRARSCVSSLLE